MTPLHDYVTGLGATIRPHPATEPAPGSAGFVPNVVATASVIAPAVPAAALLDAVVACMEGAEDWRVRARSVTGADGRAGDGDDDEDLTLDLLGEYRLGGTGLALSTLARARTAGGVTVLHQTHVTTLADQIHHHRSGLDAAAFA